MKLLAARLVVSNPAAAEEVAKFCRLKADVILNPGRIGVPWWGVDTMHPANELLLVTNQLGSEELIELAEYIEDRLPRPGQAARAAA